MADIALVIRIAEESYKEIKKIVADRNDHYFLENIIANGTPLPKGHGDLIDRDDLLADSYPIDDYAGNEVNIVDVMTVEMADTIIEADKAESEVQDADSD